MTALSTEWQWIAVGVIELVAIGYLLRRMFGRVTPAARRGPDVRASSLVRKKK